MNFDVQIRFDALRARIRTDIQKRLLDTDQFPGGIDQVDFTPLSGGMNPEPAVIDHLEFRDEDIILERMPGLRPVSILLPDASGARAVDIRAPRWVLRATARVFFVRVADLNANGRSPSPRDRMLEVGIRASFILGAPRLSSDGSTSIIDLMLQPLEVMLGNLPVPAGLVPAGVTARLTQLQASGALTMPPIQLPLGGLLELLNSQGGSPFAIANVGLQGFNRIITIRIEARRDGGEDDPAAIEAEWRSFLTLASAVQDRMGHSEWGFFVPSLFFDEQIRDAVDASLAGRSDLRLNDDNLPRTEWIARKADGAQIATGCADPGSVTPVTRFSVKLPGACIPFGYDIDVNIRLDIAIRFARRPDGGHALELEIRFNHAVDEGDAILCAVSFASFFGAAGAGIGAASGGWVGAVVGGIIGNLLGIGVVVGLIETAGPTTLKGLNPLRDENGNEIPNAYIIETELKAIESESFGRLVPTALVACVDGLAIAGQLPPPRGRGIPRLRDPIEIARFEWGGSSVCPAPPERVVARAFTTINLEAPFRTAGAIPLHVLHEEILESTPRNIRRFMFVPPATGRASLLDPQFDFEQYRAMLSEAVGEVPRYLALVRTNAGARIFEVRIEGDLSAEAAEQARAISEGFCHNFDRLKEAFRRSRSFRNIFGRLIPGPRPSPAVGLWRFSLSGIGLRAGSAFSLVELGQKDSLGTLQTIWSGAQGTASFSLFRFERDEESTPVGVAGLAEALQNPGEKGRTEVVLAVDRFAEVASFPVSGTYRDHALEYAPGRVALAVISDRAATLYAGWTATRLHRVAVQHVRGLVRVKAAGGRAIAYGSGEAWQFGTSRSWRRLALLRYAALRLTDASPALARSAAWLDARTFRCGCSSASPPSSEPPLLAASAPARQAGDLAAVFDQTSNSVVVFRRIDRTVITPRSDDAPTSVTLEA